MERAWSWFKLNILKWIYPPKPVEIIDIIQIILIAYFVYHLIMWFRNTRAYMLLKGIVFVMLFFVIATVLHMDTIMWILDKLSLVAITAIIIIFQPELRKALERMGKKNPLLSLLAYGKLSSENQNRFSDGSLNEIARASFDMADVKTGALIIIENQVRLDEFVQTGIQLNADISSQLICNIFEHNTPLHDGAIIIRDDKIIAATCYLPLSENMEINKKLGTRHRAGLGISEVSDCFTIIVSEETGKVSYAFEGRLITGVSLSELKEKLYQIQKSGTPSDNLILGRDNKA